MKKEPVTVPLKKVGVSAGSICQAQKGDLEPNGWCRAQEVVPSKWYQGHKETWYLMDGAKHRREIWNLMDSAEHKETWYLMDGAEHTRRLGT